MTQRYLNTPDQQIHELGMLLQEYENFSKQLISKMQQNKSYLQQNNLDQILKDIAKKYYKKGIEWMKEKVDEDQVYMYMLSEYDLETLDNDYKIIGYSQKLLNLIGLNEVEANNVFMRRGRLEIFDGLSRLYRLMVRLVHMRQTNLGQAFTLDHNIISIDGLNIPNKCEIMIPPFSCITKDDLKDYDYFGEFLMSRYCTFRLFHFHINPNILQQVLSLREQQQNSQYFLQDMEYSMLRQIIIYYYLLLSVLKVFWLFIFLSQFYIKSEVFIDKFYPKAIQNTNKSKQEKQEAENIKFCKYRKNESEQKI